MKQLQFYKYAALGLLLLNIGVLMFFVWSKPKPPRSMPASDFRTEVVRLLNLDETQKNSFEQLAQEHGQQLRKIREQQTELLVPYFESIASPVPDIDNEDILRQFRQMEQEKIETTYNHLSDIKALLDEGQVTNFKPFMKQFLNRVMMNPGEQNPPRRGHHPPPPRKFG